MFRHTCKLLILLAGTLLLPVASAATTTTTDSTTAALQQALNGHWRSAANRARDFRTTSRMTLRSPAMSNAMTQAA